jgi:hypothetical protein
MNPWCTPERVSVRHLKNKVTDLRADRRPAGSLLFGLKSPEQLETHSARVRRRLDPYLSGSIFEGIVKR